MLDRDQVARSIGSNDVGFRSEHRLRTAADFSLVFGGSRVLRGNRFDLHYRSRDSQDSPPLAGARLGLVVAKRLARRAVLRNLLKRLARETFRHARPKLAPYDLVLRLAKPAGNCLDRGARKAWCVEIEELLRRLPP